MATMNHPNLFTAVELTDAVNKLPRIPLRLGSLFEERGVRTTNVTFDVKQGRLFYVENQDRSAGPKHIADRGSKRSAKVLACSHLPLADTVRPEDIQDVRGFGSDEPVGAATVINDKMQDLKAPLEATVEYHRLGAIKGKVMDADGKTVLHDYYSVFEVTKQTQDITFPSTASIKNNPIMDAILAGKRAVANKASGLPIRYFEALVGSGFYDALTGHELVRKAFDLWLANQANWGDNDYRKRGFMYGGVIWVEASEQVDDKPLVETDKAHMYPVAPGVFKTFNAPANWMSTVNTIGRPFYAQMGELEMDRGFELEVQTNPLCMCMYPEALVEFTAK